jgi:copper chaperone
VKERIIVDAIELKVDGMTCGSCVKAATRALAAVSGVQTVDVSLEQGSASVRGEDVVTRVAALVAALAGIGFPARVSTGEPNGAATAPARHGCGGSKGGGCCCGH